MNNAAKPPQRMPLMLENGQDYSLRETGAANKKNSISGNTVICRGQLV